MRKQGPCRHCGVTSTPLWRNGPPEKPVLCNACGSRWRTKGSLTNYIPLHAREPLSSDDLNAPKLKSISFKLNDHKSQKKRQNDSALESELKVQYCDQNFRKIEEGDSSNRCSSESAISGSESYVHFSTTDASDITGSVQSNAWDSVVPSKKRTFMSRPKPSPVEKLTKDLYFILHEEQASNLTITSEDDLLYDSAAPFDSSEIGYGGILIKRPHSKSIEEESEASSFALDKSHGNNEGYSGGSTHFLATDERNARSLLNYGNGKLKSSAVISHENAKRYKTSHEKLQILQDRNSPLGSADLDVSINYEVFMKSLAYKEQQLLMKYLPSVDTVEPPESLKDMFASRQFSETFSFFQRLLEEGVFDLSWTGANAEDCRQLKKLLLLNCANSKWLECYQRLKDATSKKIIGNGKLSKHMQAELSEFASLKRDYEKQNKKHLVYAEQKTTMRSPKRLCSSGVMNPPSKCSSQLEPSAVSKITDGTGELVDHDGAFFNSRRVPSFLSDRTSMLAPTCFVADNSDADLLLDVRYGASFPEAELIYPPWEQEKNQKAYTAESGLEAADHPSSSFSNK